MQRFSILNSRIAPLIGDNINTDVIIPMDRYVLADKNDMHKFAFESLRFSNTGKKNKNFILNQKSFSSSKILLVGHNFGCGSSREAAVWAIFGLGFRCIIGRSFGDIFFNNCFQNGILPITLEESIMQELTSHAFSASVEELFSVNLLTMQITSPKNNVWDFKIEEYRRLQLIEGLDDISSTLKKSKEIDEFRRLDKKSRPWVYL